MRNVIVNEFGRPEPSPRLVDAITAYMEQIDLLPNPKLKSDGQLSDAAEPAARRGEVPFNRSFPQMGNQSCASCHHPSALFVDHLQHYIGTGGAFKTQTLLNADFTAPYFHDDRYATFGQVVEYFDGYYKLGLTVGDKSDLVAYLQAVGDGEQPFENNTPERELDELLVFSRPLERAIAEQAGLVIQLRRVQSAAQAGRYQEAMAALKTFRSQADAARPLFLAALPVSLYDPALAAQHQALVAELTPPVTQPVPLATAGSHANP